MSTLNPMNNRRGFAPIGKAASPRQAAFTLVELLVVIGIIALLVGILLPALGRARESADQVKCAANLKQIGVAIFMYTGQYRGSLPVGLVANGDTYPEGGTYQGENHDWATLLMYVMQRKAKGIGDSQDPHTIGQAGNIKEVFICPTVYLPQRSPSARVSHYSAHPRIMPNLVSIDYYAAATGGGFRGLKPYKLTKIKRASEIGLIFEGAIDYSTGVMGGFFAQATCNAINRDGLNRAPLFLTDTYGRVPTNPPLGPNTPIDLHRVSDGWTADKDLNRDSFANRGNIRFRHLKDSRQNVLMADGHVESFTFNPKTQKSNILYKNVCVNP
ncbi:MAG: DUF1559 domain-containing protein [Phycisphaerae bacterium]|nr:DUF1559 domain-containing protein [Phycisphaerae bacterium]MDW8263002.1 DUF1559 domain-containing protein [Phycisphaerales bacterium]